MKEGERRDELDGLIERALGSYSAREPREGLERRVLERVRSEGGVRRAPRWMWALAAAAGVVVAVAVFRSGPTVPEPTEERVTEPERAAVFTPSREPAVPEKTEIGRERAMVREVERVERRLPRRPVFPTPAPLTEEEKLLLALVRSVPGEELTRLAGAQQGEIEPVRFEEIEIRPLEIEVLQ